MAYQSEAALEQQFIEQLNKQGYNPVSIPDYDALLLKISKYNSQPSMRQSSTIL